MLGELYQPKGLARETAQAVLEVDEPYAVNVAWGCRNQCDYCYIQYIKKGDMRLPSKPVVDLVLKQLQEGLRPKGVFVSFNTEPLLLENYANTWALIRLLRGWDIRVAVLSKEGVLPVTDWEIRHGVTLVSLSSDFAKMYEPKAVNPLKRLDALKLASEDGAYTWVSIEPYPPPEVFKQDLRTFLEHLDFVDFMIFGKWNYDSRCNTVDAKEFYKLAAVEFVDFCKAHGIRYHVKSDTLGGENVKR